jgi:hypothetical protein
VAKNPENTGESGIYPGGAILIGLIAALFAQGSYDGRTADGVGTLSLPTSRLADAQLCTNISARRLPSSPLGMDS